MISIILKLIIKNNFIFKKEKYLEEKGIKIDKLTEIDIYNIYDFDKKTYINKGSFGIVYKCRNKIRNEDVAIKLYKNNCNIELVEKELLAYKYIGKHENIIEIY